MLRVNHEQVANDTGCCAMQAMDPFAAVRAKNKAQGLQVNNPLEVEKAKNEQQAKARQMVLQQQAISTAAAASKTQREVYIGNLQQVCGRLCSCVRPCGLPVRVSGLSCWNLPVLSLTPVVFPALIYVCCMLCCVL